MPSLSHALVPNSFPLLHLIIYLDSYCTSMVTSNLIVSHHPRPNASYPADLLSHCFPGPLPSNPFICHTSEISPVTPIIATDPTSHVRNSFACRTCKTPRRILHAAQPFPFPEESVKKPGGTGTPVSSIRTCFTHCYQEILYRERLSASSGPRPWTAAGRGRVRAPHCGSSTPGCAAPDAPAGPILRLRRG